MLNNYSIINSLYELLPRLDLANGKRTELRALIQSIELDFNSVKSYCCWNKNHYTRNLIRRTEEYELLVLCWQKGQFCPIHDHGEQDCFMYIITGELEETQYQLNEQKSSKKSLVEIKRNVYGSRNKICIFSATLWHSVKVLSEQAVTLHFYSKPIDKCRIYYPETKEMSTCQLNYSNDNKINELAI
ncbi:MAG: hypothetical protein F6J86_01380 [Symploca sp. SIO1B1]|nr:hypothetical protein [Symploca sp. SIO1C2]NER92514.1 hypothetical protein [Symploca sp. SIO1B1]